MPIEIRELVIRATIDAESQGGGAGGKAAVAKKASGADREAIVSECVEQVIRILERERER